MRSNRIIGGYFDYEKIYNCYLCFVLHQWVLELVILDAEPYSILGVPMVLTINRSDGSMALYHSDTSLWLHEIEW